jgi:Nickel responsive protein SCO4226-like
MQTYLVVRPFAWRSEQERHAAEERSAVEAARMSDDIASIRAYALEERDWTIGSVCVYQATSPEAIRRHAAAAGLPVDEIVKVTDESVRGSDLAATAARERGET